MGFTDGGEETLLCAVRLYGMGVPPCGALDMTGCLHITTCYLLRDEHEDLEPKFHSWIVNVKIDG